MADKHLMTLTYAGRDLIVPHFTEGVEGKVGDIIFSRVVAGDDILPDEVNLRELTEIENQKLEMPVTACELKEYNGERAAYLEAALQSVTLEEGFRVRVIGIYARDPYTDKEILYAVSHFPQVQTTTENEDGTTTVTIEETGEWMPAIGSGKIVDVLYTIITVIGQAENVICNIVDDIIHVTIKEFRDHVNDTNPHPNMPHLDGTKADADFLLGQKEGDQNFYKVSFGNVVKQLLPETVSKIGISGDADGDVTTNKTTGATDIKLTNIRATRLKTPRTIRITGKASGSASFDGTANVSIPLSGVDADKLSGKTLQWILDQIKDIQTAVAGMGDGLPVGTILAYAGDIDNIPDGWHLCDGKDNTPDLRDRFLMGWGSYAAGKKLAAGLPNIQGRVYAAPVQGNSSPSGPFSRLTQRSGAPLWNWQGTADYGIAFDASKSNNIYGAANTVRPPSYTVYYIIKTGISSEEGGES